MSSNRIRASDASIMVGKSNGNMIMKTVLYGTHANFASYPPNAVGLPLFNII